MPQSGPGAAAEADASGKQQLKRTQSGSSSLHRELSGAGLRTVGERGGSTTVAERAKRAQLLVIIMFWWGTCTSSGSNVQSMYPVDTRVQMLQDN